MALIDRDYFNMLPLGTTKQMQPYMEAIDTFLETASQQVEAYCERKFELQEHVEVLWGTGRQKLIVDQYPVQSIQSVTYEDDFGGSWSHDPNYFRVHPSGVLEWKFPMSQGPWRRDRIYTVTYTAGYDPVPAPIKHATALWATELMRPNFAGPQPERPAELIPFTTEQIGELLENYRRRRIG
jgi:hypothetical protein